MNLLAIETSTEACSVALMLDGEVSERYAHAPRQHAELLLPWVQALLAEGGVGFSVLDAIAFSRGPGSFTSLRIGIGVVQGLAWASERPVVPVSSLAATAQSVAGNGMSTVLVALDARMNEVFTGAFSLDSNAIMQPLAPEKVCPPEAVQIEPTWTANDTRVHGIGIGFDRYPQLLDLKGDLAAIVPHVWPRATAVLTLAQDWLQSHQALPAEQAQPVYLRDRVATPQKSGTQKSDSKTTAKQA